MARLSNGYVMLGSGRRYYQLRLNGIQPSYSVTRTSGEGAALSLNGIANTYRVRN